jgi:hypothetical protein
LITIYAPNLQLSPSSSSLTSTGLLPPGGARSATSVQKQYTHDRFGKVARIAQVSNYPYLFARMQLDSSALYHPQRR